MKTQRTLRALLMTIAGVSFVAAAVQSAQAAPIAPGDPAHLWLFDEGTGSTAVDTGTTGGSDGTLMGTPAWSANTPFSYAGNRSVSTFVREVQAPGFTMGSQQTISMWVGHSTTPTAPPKYILDSTGNRTLVYLEQTPLIYWSGQSLGTGGLIQPTGSGWEHIALVRNGTNVAVYENGVLKSNKTVSAADSNPTTWYFGSRYSQNEQWKGEIDEYAFWDTALSADNIEWLSQNSLGGSTGPGPPPGPTNLALGKEYAFYQHLPGQNPGVGPHYLDDGHAGTNALGVFDAGELTDGMVAGPADHAGSTNNQYVGFYGTPGALPAAEIVFDLGAEYAIDDIVIGTASRGCCGSGSPDDVDISFSTTSATAGFGPATNFTLWGPGTLPVGHYEMTLAASSPSARYVKLSFDGGNHGGGVEKYMLDEISINGRVGGAGDIPEPATLALLSLAAAGLGGYVRRRRKA